MVTATKPLQKLARKSKAAYCFRRMQGSFSHSCGPLREGNLFDETPQVETCPVDQLRVICQAVPVNHVAVQISQCQVDGRHPHAAQVDVLPQIFSIHQPHQLQILDTHFRRELEWWIS